MPQRWARCGSASRAGCLALPSRSSLAPCCSHATPWVIAHRGGLAQWPENTELAFEKCVELGVDLLEIDIHRSKDGALVVIHDPTVDRTTEGSGSVSGMTVSALQALDAAYRFGEEAGYPLRGQGVHIPTLEHVLGRFESTRINIELKADDLEAPLCDLLLESRAAERVIVASISSDRLDRFRERCPKVATSASAREATRFWLLAQIGLAGPAPAPALQLADRIGSMPVITSALVWAAQKRGLAIHVFTINDRMQMHQFLDRGVHGIMTDRPELLKEVITERRRDD